MNRKQQLVMWVTGLVLAGVSAWKSSDWLYEYFVPIAILGTLLYVQVGEPDQASRSVRASALLIFAFVVLFHTHTSYDEVSGVSSSITDIESAVETLESDSAEMKAKLEDLESTLGEMELQLAEVYNRLQ